jgi:hypothetical protein
MGQALCLSAQERAEGSVIVSQTELPDTPIPQVEIAAADSPALQVPPQQDQTAQPPVPVSGPVPATAAPDSANSQSGTQPAGEEDKRKKAEEQIKQQEHQRMLGIIPSFNTSYVSDAVSLTPKQKISLAFHSVTDPYAFALAFVVAGRGEAQGHDQRFGWGPTGYFKRSGAAYLDAFDGNMIGNAFLPIVLHQDPRYFRLGHGSAGHRLLYAVSTSFICKHDNSGKWEPNYSNVGGNIISGAISNVYYPDAKNGIAQTFEAGITVTLEGTFGATLQEFWPDIARKLFHKDPTHGLDAQNRAADEAKKQAAIGKQ